MRTQIFALIVLIFVACQKQDTQLHDNIIYTDINPDTIVSSIDTVYYLGYDDAGGVFKLNSLESTGNYSIDLNGDNILDLRFEHKFWEQDPFYQSPHWWGGYYQNLKIEVYGINGALVSGMNEEDLAEHSGMSFPPNPIGNIYGGTNISDTTSWIESGIIYINSQGWLYFYESESQYVAVKIESQDEMLFGWVKINLIKKELNIPLEDGDGMAINTAGSEWIKELVISGWAINMTNKNSILAGQIE